MVKRDCFYSTDSGEMYSITIRVSFGSSDMPGDLVCISSTFTSAPRWVISLVLSIDTQGVTLFLRLC